MAINLKDAKNGDKFQTVTGHTVVYHQDENKLDNTVARRDLLDKIYAMLEKGIRNYKNLNQDLKAQRLKLENIISKVKNANLYIEEIDKHRKSI